MSNDGLKWIPFERAGRWRASVRTTNDRVVGFVLTGFVDDGKHAVLHVNADNVIVGNKTFDHEGLNVIGRFILTTLVDATKHNIQKLTVYSLDPILSQMIKTLLHRLNPKLETIGYASDNDGIWKASRGSAG